VPRPKTHDEALRTRLLDRAGEVLSAEGPHALSLRRLAADVGTSTTAVYSLFGGKPALMRAVYREAFRRFSAHLATVRASGDPAEDLVRLGLAYRSSALADPHLYSIMFTRVVPEFTPDEETAAESRATFQPLLEIVRRAMRAGVFVAAPPERIALALWGLVHGLMSLELGDNLPGGLDVAASFEPALRAAVDGWCIPPGEPEGLGEAAAAVPPRTP
jgi:AcrR family transcriptional regulator